MVYHDLDIRRDAVNGFSFHPSLPAFVISTGQRHFRIPSLDGKGSGESTSEDESDHEASVQTHKKCDQVMDSISMEIDKEYQFASSEVRRPQLSLWEYRFHRSSSSDMCTDEAVNSFSAEVV